MFRASHEDVRMFTEGCCYVLAAEISRRTGWSVYGFGRPGGSPGIHAFVLMPDGMVLDVRGVQTQQKMCSDWGEDSIIPFGASDHHIWDVNEGSFLDSSFPGYRERSIELADRLLDGSDLSV